MVCTQCLPGSYASCRTHRLAMPRINLKPCSTPVRVSGSVPRCLLPQGFDEYMNIVLDGAQEVSVKRKTRKDLGRILLKGDTITLMQAAK
jgi:hypothetical protein